LSILSTIAKWLFILCLPVLLLTASIGGAVNSLWLYKYGFEKNNVSQTTGLTESELEMAAVGLISYFNSGEEYISLTVVREDEVFELFYQQEVAHLRDVKGLFWLNYWLLLGTLVYALIFSAISLLRHQRRRLAWGAVGGSSLTLFLMLALGLGTLLGFDRLFWQFHLISFSNELWRLDPTKDYLIMLFPQAFWYEATLLCVLAAVVGAVVIGGVAGVYLKRTKK